MITSTELQLLLCTCICMLSIIMNWKGIIKPIHLNFYQIISIFVGIYFGLGTWTAFIYGNFSLPIEKTHIIFETYLVIAFYLTGLKLIERLAVSRIDQKLPYYENHFTIITFFYSYYKISWQRIIIVVLCVWLLRIYLGLRYGLWLSGSAKAETVLLLPYSIVVINQITIIIMQGCQIWAAASFWSDRRFAYKFYSLAILLSEFFWTFLRGRRWIIMWIIFILFGFFCSGKKLSFKYVITFLVIMFFIINFIFPFFLSVRTTRNTTFAKNQDAFSSFNNSAIYAYKNFKKTSKKINNENMRERPLGLYRFIAQICESSQNNPLMLGNALFRSIIMAVPSAIVPMKRGLLTSEQYIQQHYKLNQTDSANTWPAVGYADFGIAGGFIVGIIVGSLILIIANCSKFILPTYPLISLSFIGSLILNLIQVEADPNAWWTLCRNIVVVIFIAKFLDIFYLRKK